MDDGMKGDVIPDIDNIARYCSPSKLHESTGKPLGSAFEVKEDGYASVNWLDRLTGADKEQKIAELRTIFESKFNIRKNGRFAVLKIQDVKTGLFVQFKSLRFLHEPEPDDDTHSGIFDFAADGEAHIFQDMLSTHLDWELFPGKL
jgi:hypothetical protein